MLGGARGSVVGWWRKARGGEMARAAGAQEILDGSVPAADREKSLLDIGRLNALFGGRRVTLAALEKLVAASPPGRRLTVLDVGTGIADIPRAVVRWCRRAGRSVRVFALDRDAGTLAIARAASAGYPEIVFLQGDALDLPVRRHSVDIILSALTLHHLEPGPAERYLAQMARSTRWGLVVNDLERSRAAWLLVWLVTRTFATSGISRHDGPLSVCRAYTAREVRALCDAAGLGAARIHRYPALFRQCVVLVKA